MSKYTTELRSIIDANCGLDEDASISDKITAAAPKIFNFPFPIWDEADRATLEFMILQKYYMREIAFETVGLWKFYLNQKMMEIMPYYVELYKTTQLKYDFLQPFTITETYTETGNRDHSERIDNTVHESGSNTETATGTTKTEGTSNTERTSNDTSNNTQIFSDLPQATLSAANVDYATGSQTSETKNTGQNTGTTSQNASESTESDRHGTTSRDVSGDTDRNGSENFSHTHKLERVGNTSANYSQLVQEYRESILMIPPLIVKDLGCLFFSLW